MISPEDILTHDINNAHTIIGCICRRLNKTTDPDEAAVFINIIKIQVERLEAAYECYSKSAV